MEESIQYAKKYLENLLSFFGLNVDVYATSSDGEVIELHVPSSHLNGFLIGQHGDTMRALQFTVMSALKNNNYEIARVNVDIADYKKNRADRLAVEAEAWVLQVKTSGVDMELKPMNAADRRTVHQVAGDAGLATESVGEARERRVVLKASGAAVIAEEVADTVEDVAEPAEKASKKVVKEPSKAAETTPDQADSDDSKD